MSTYEDKVECPKGHKFWMRRRAASAGRVVTTMCPACRTSFDTVAGPLPADVSAAPKYERQIEARLVKRVGELGGEVRKVKWEGRRGAPDRFVMLPGGRVVLQDMRVRNGRAIWVELKKPGGAAKFPKNAHEQAQAREHERMRAMGQHVVVIDSYEQIEELLK